MSQQPEALRLADLLETDGWPDAAAELRRLHEENAGLREQNTELDATLVRLEVAVRQALGYLDSPSSKMWPAGTHYKIIAALRNALGEEHA